MDLSFKQSGSVASGSVRQNPIQAMLLARDGSQGRAAGTRGNPIQAHAQLNAQDMSLGGPLSANANDGIGDFNLGFPHTATGNSGRGWSGRSHRNPIQAQLMAREGNQGFAPKRCGCAGCSSRGGVSGCCLKADSTCFKADSTRFSDRSWPS